MEKKKKLITDAIWFEFGTELKKNKGKLLANKTHAFLKRRFKKPKNNC